MMRGISDEMILRNFLMQFHLRQGHQLTRIPKFLLDKNWIHGVRLFVSMSSYIGRKKSIYLYEHDIVIPFTDEILRRVEAKTDGCDAIIFHTLPLPGYVNGCVETSSSVSARIITFSDTDTTRLDISFTPMWVRREPKDRLYRVWEDLDHGE